jgi:hypothetical protein
MLGFTTTTAATATSANTGTVHRLNAESMLAKPAN